MTRIVTVRDFFDLSECDGVASKGPLMFREPAEIYWYGRRLGATETQAKILGMLIRFGCVASQVLIFALPSPHSAGLAVKVHICRLRILLKFATDARVRIENIRGEGYRLVVEE